MLDDLTSSSFKDSVSEEDQDVIEEMMERIEDNTCLRFRLGAKKRNKKWVINRPNIGDRVKNNHQQQSNPGRKRVYVKYCIQEDHYLFDKGLIMVQVQFPYA